MYDGEFEEGKYCGEGILIEPDGDRYEGEFEDGLRHGHGSYETEKKV